MPQEIIEGDVKRLVYPNGSEVVSHRLCGLMEIKGKNPFGGFWTQQAIKGIHNQRTGNPSEAGVFRRGRKWHLGFNPDEGYFFGLPTKGGKA